MTLLDVITMVQKHFCLITCNFYYKHMKYAIFTAFSFCKCNALKHIEHPSKNSLQIKGAEVGKFT